ncbi:hypothetical protein [Streptomyces luteogriseus]|uniref:hypothetical protein n=1 Tax=Streptomyces luteogriseus TaxID=68233 RepID=UPI0037A33B24
MEKHVEAHNLIAGDLIRETWIGADVREDGTQYAQFRIHRPTHDLPNYRRIARKYFRMRPFSLSWLEHVWDHIQLSREAKRYPCYLKQQGKCHFC